MEYPEYPSLLSASFHLHPLSFCFLILFPVVSSFLPNCLLHSAFRFNSLPSSSPVVMTPSSRMMLEWSNCPRIPASLKKDLRCLSEQPALSVFMATGSSLLLGSFRQPRHTSPKSPVGRDRQAEVTIPMDRGTNRSSGERTGQNVAGQME